MKLGLKTAQMLILLVTFLTAFIATTYLTDWVCWHNGYFQEGVDDERAALGS